MATHIVSATDTEIAKWLQPVLEGKREAGLEAHKLWIHPILAVIHQIFLEWWLNLSSQSNLMRAKYTRFIEIAHSNYNHDPSPFGHPSAEGASFLLTLNKPKTASWSEKLYLEMFRSKAFLAPYIDKYKVQEIDQSSKTSAPQPLLSPQEKAKRNQDDDQTTAILPL